MEQRPDVFDYLCAVDFLKDYFVYRKTLTPTFSYEKWADELGLGSRSLLRLILSRKRNITDAVIDCFCLKIFEHSNEREQFCDLVILGQTRSTEEKKLATRRVKKRLKNSDIHVSELTAASYIASPLALRLFTILDDERVVKTPEGLSDFLRQDQDQVSATLSALASEKLVSVESGEILMRKSEFRIQDHFQNRSLELFHETSLKEAVAARSLPFDQRRFKSSIAMLSQESFDIVLRHLDDVVEMMISLGHQRSLEPVRLFQLKLNIHAVSEETTQVAGKEAQAPSASV